MSIEIAINAHQKGYKEALMESIIAIDKIIKNDNPDAFDKAYNLGVIHAIRIINSRLEDFNKNEK